LWTWWWTLGFHKKVRYFLTSWVTISFSNNILHHGMSEWVPHKPWESTAQVSLAFFANFTQSLMLIGCSKKTNHSFLQQDVETCILLVPQHPHNCCYCTEIVTGANWNSRATKSFRELRIHTLPQAHMVEYTFYRHQSHLCDTVQVCHQHSIPHHCKTYQTQTLLYTVTLALADTKG